MSLPANLNTNEVKNSSGVELEFLRVGPHKSNPTRSLEFQHSLEVPSSPFRIIFSHAEQGDERNNIRRSLFKTFYTVDAASLVDITIPSKIIATTVLQVPQGNLKDFVAVKNVMAAHGSCLMSRGVDSTILFNCTGIGAEVLTLGVLG